MTMRQASSKGPQDLTPAHVRAARALLAWSQQDLAKNAGVAASTVADFERGHRTPVPNNAQAIRTALENAGVRFLPQGAVIGPALPQLANPDGPGAPIRWVTATDLADWAQRLSGNASLPTLLAKLIRAGHGATAELRFPSDEGIQHEGWDGVTNAEQATLYVPQGPAGWEIGTQRNAIAKKASDDYAKRTANPGILDPATSTFIFITSRHWPKKDEWAKARRDEGLWKDVRAYDGDDLIHWVELNPAVGQWLATVLEKRPPGIRQLDEVWQEWSLATRYPLTPELILSDRDQDAASILRWLRSEASVQALQAETPEEVTAFFYATIKMLPPEVAAHYMARCLVATSAEAARQIADAPPPLIIVLWDTDPGLAQRIAQRGHYVLLAYGGTPNLPGEVRTLPRPSREGIAEALIDMNIAEARAQGLARDSSRSLAVLRRLIPGAAGRLPLWAQSTPSRALLAAVLAGSWDDASEADRAQLSRLAGIPYEALVQELALLGTTFDSPLRKIGTAWRLASPPDAWLLLANYLSSIDVSRFEAVAIDVLGSADPRYELAPDERWLASMKGIKPQFSGLLRYGIGEVLILLALYGDKISTVPDASKRADAIVRTILHNADPQRWWSLSRSFQLLAEASPTAFLDAVEHSLDQNDPPIKVLFGADGDPIFGSEHLSDLLWALEALGWSQHLLPRVSLLLARLDAIDPGGRFTNRPANSLRQIHLLWSPQTSATLDQRLRVLDLLRRTQSNAAWKLMLGILPSGHDSFSPSPPPRWRDYSADKPEIVTYPLMARGAEAIGKRLLEDVGISVPRWILLLERLSDVAADRTSAITQLAQAEEAIKAMEDREQLRVALRQLLHNHRQIPDANWALPGEELAMLAAIYDKLAPKDIVQRHAWLFNHSVALPDPTTEGWETEQGDVRKAREAAALEVHQHKGLDGLFDLARIVPAAGYLGAALASLQLPEPVMQEILERALRSDNAQDRDIAHGLIITLFQERKETWAEALLNKAVQGNWGDDALLTILRALPYGRWTWMQVQQLGSDLDAVYWRRAPILWVDGSADDIVYAAERLIGVGRAHDAVHLVGRDLNKMLPTALLVEVLKKAASEPLSKNSDRNEPVMFQHHVTEILKRLDTAKDVSEDTMLGLEWAYLPILRYSRRPAKVLLKALAERPSFFVDVLRAVFKPSEDSRVDEEAPRDLDTAQAIATQAYSLLDLWNVVPGTQADGHIDGSALNDWIEEARSLTRKIGREEIADSRIGTILSASPMGTDGIWPAEPVRAALEKFYSARLLNGFIIGKRNRRGVTTRLPRDGGAQEHGLSGQFRKWADATAYEYLHTSEALRQLAESYDIDARRHDDDAERLDWER